ncbi:TlpA family protein disulfide reductase [Tenacibaculum sp. M341]|uniref:TlpA family protein disulfide reductase n=1 Tax=Tenacibaculum sp. M341 TaxID=2530339 RepID=UPI001044FC7F|nr:TlpA disulfide reductase family protein [Tenacibaculum sp. M341]TCI92144.1 TlpA family protein disulfide reductase [Tenacibaculum sp. M341]
MKKIVTYVLLFTTTAIFGQRINFEIRNDSIGNVFTIRSLTNKALETVVIKEQNFKVDINFDKGYYLLEKEGNTIPLFLKPSDEFNIAFDANNFYETLVISGQNSAENSYLLSRKQIFLNDVGNLKKYHKKSFYEGDENDYLVKLDALYNDFYGTLFSGDLDQQFVDDEMKNLQYAYYYDILRFEDAKKHYKFTDSITVSKRFLQPLNTIHFDSQLLFEKYPDYKNLSILKWKKEIERYPTSTEKEEVLNSIRTAPLKQGVLWSLYNDMGRDNPKITKEYFKIIKTYAERKELITKAKEKYDEIRNVEAEKNLSKFDYRNIHGEAVKLSDYAGNYIFIGAWASWCKRCLKDFEKIEELKEKYSDKPIVFVGISLDNQEDFNKWLTVIKEKNLRGTGEHLFFKGDKSKFIQAYEMSGIPSYMLLSLKGLKLEKNLSNVSVKKVEKMLDKYLNPDN